MIIPIISPGIPNIADNKIIPVFKTIMMPKCASTNNTSPAASELINNLKIILIGNDNIFKTTKNIANATTYDKICIKNLLNLFFYYLSVFL